MNYISSHLEIKRILSISVFLGLLGLSLKGQESISTSGDYMISANGTMSFTIGEPIIETFIGSENTITQGFQQSNIVVTIIDELKGLDYKISVFPNPVLDFFEIIIDKAFFKNMRYSLLDLKGKLIQQNLLEENKTLISIQGLNPANYILSIYDNDKVVATFKIVKIK